MARLPVLPYPNPFLRKAAAPVVAFDDDLRTLVADMVETMGQEDGVGLAATQVGRDLRLLVLDPYAFEGEAGRGKPPIAVANPEVVWQSEECALGEEGCLSFPGVFIQVERPVKVRIRAQDAEGVPFELEGEGFAARAILHELDHLKGVVMIDHVSFLQRQRALKKHDRNQAVVAQEKATRASKPGARAGATARGRK